MKKLAMKRYFSWLKRRLRIGLPSATYVKLDGPCQRVSQTDVPTFGLDVERLRDWFAAISIDGSEPGELAGYARQDLERFLRTIELVPEQTAACLEIGANPYFTTTLLSWLRPQMDLSLTNYFGNEPESRHRQEVVVESPHGIDKKVFDYLEINVEHHRLPYQDAHFQAVLFCEVLEHMTADPVATLCEIRRVLHPAGHLILTTPNVARIENRARLLAGLNIYDPYSGHGVYGRHNREYTCAEIRALLDHCGFEEEVLYTADVHVNHAPLHVADRRQLDDIFRRAGERGGQYIFSRWRVSGRTVTDGKPAWLYRSISTEQLSDAVPLVEQPDI